MTPQGNCGMSRINITKTTQIDHSTSLTGFSDGLISWSTTFVTTENMFDIEGSNLHSGEHQMWFWEHRRVNSISTTPNVNAIIPQLKDFPTGLVRGEQSQWG
jgi:hypothetical protein